MGKTTKKCARMGTKGPTMSCFRLASHPSGYSCLGDYVGVVVTKDGDVRDATVCCSRPRDPVPSWEYALREEVQFQKLLTRSPDSSAAPPPRTSRTGTSWDGMGSSQNKVA